MSVESNAASRSRHRHGIESKNEAIGRSRAYRAIDRARSRSHDREKKKRITGDCALEISMKIHRAIRSPRQAALRCSESTVHSSGSNKREPRFGFGAPEMRWINRAAFYRGYKTNIRGTQCAKPCCACNVSTVRARARTSMRTRVLLKHRRAGRIPFEIRSRFVLPRTRSVSCDISRESRVVRF